MHQSFTARHNRRRWILHTVHTRVREGAIDASSRKKNNRDLSSDGCWWRMCAAACWYAREEICLLDARSNPESSIARISAFFLFQNYYIGDRQRTRHSPPANIKLASFFLFFSPLWEGSRWAFFNLGFGMGSVSCFIRDFEGYSAHFSGF